MIQIEVKRPDCGHLCKFSTINDPCIECKKNKKPVVFDVELKLNDEKYINKTIDLTALQTFEEKVSYVNETFKNLRNIHSEFVVGQNNELILKVFDTYKKIEMEFVDDEKFNEFFVKFCENFQYIGKIDEFGESVLSLIVDENYRKKYIDRFGRLVELAKKIKSE